MMLLSLPDVQVGQAAHLNAIDVFPLFSEPQAAIEYRLSDEALADGTLVVREVSEAASVTELLAENAGDVRVLFIEGEELVGAKQNRILNVTLLVAAKSTLKVPVSCVERGRWHYRSRHFGSSGSHAPSHLRYALKASVTDSLDTRMCRESRQCVIWDEVAQLQQDHVVGSQTSAMSDVFEHYSCDLNAFRETLKYAENATGVAVALGGKVIALDLFDKPDTCRKVWNRLLSGFALDALKAAAGVRPPTAAHVEQLLDAAAGADWRIAKPLGEGQEYRAAFDTVHGSALRIEDTIVHASLLAR